jgi:transposase/transcriptional regulator with XRE-family HTH domain
MSKFKRKYVSHNRDQMLLLPPNVNDWVEDDHLAKWVAKAVDRLNLDCFYALYELDDKKSARPGGRPPYDPAMMLTMVLYALACRQTSSRRMESMTRNDLGARWIMGNNHPDHSVFAAFRDAHKGNMEVVFAEVLLLCHGARLIDLTHVAIDSTVIKANASQNGAVRVDELEVLNAKAKAESARLLKELDSKDLQDKSESETRQKRLKSQLAGYDRMSKFLAERGGHNHQQDSLGKAQTKEEAAEARLASTETLGQELRRIRRQKGITLDLLSQMTGIYRSSLSRYETGQRHLTPAHRSQLAQALGIDISSLPELITRVSQRIKLPSGARPLLHPSDLESYLIKRPKGYFQGYLSQAAVDGKSQIIVAAGVSPTNTDQPFLSEALEKIKAFFKRLPKLLLADTGYCSVDNIKLMLALEVDFLCPPSAVREGASRKSDLLAEMEKRLLEPAGKKDYARRSGIVEPIFGDMKTNQGFTRYFVRGLAKVAGDWFQRATVHNLMKLFRLNPAFI